MSESQRPKPAAPSFEIPDLELESLPRSRRSTATRAHSATQSSQGGSSAPGAPQGDVFDAGGDLSLDLDHSHTPGVVDFGSSFHFDAASDFELEPTAPTRADQNEPTSAISHRSGQISTTTSSESWPTGRAPDADTRGQDPIALATLAGYGAAPHSAYLTPAYAYRVFTRQRELKGELASARAQLERAELERETVLAELTRALRPVAQQLPGFVRLFAPLAELEQVASSRGQALASTSAELGAKSSIFDAELSEILEQARAQQVALQTASRAHAEREELAQRTLSKLKRVHIEIRAVTQVAEQKVGPQGGPIPEPEATQLDALRQRVIAVQTEVTHASAQLEQAKAALELAQSTLAALRQAERATARKKQALVDGFQKELNARRSGVSQSETEQRAALAEVGRALLAARGGVPISPSWLERVRVASERADGLFFKCETLRHALDAYDRARVTQGVRLTCTALGLLVLLLVLKIAL